MPRKPFPTAVEEVLTRPNPCVIATLRPDGAPISVATWYLWEAERVLVNMDAGRKRLDYIRSDPRVSLTVLADDGWNRAISLYGRVVSLEDDANLVDIDRLSTHYIGTPYPARDRARVSALVEIDSWHHWGFDQD
jgi:PPOX class probable F420-dependent enzyme